MAILVSDMIARMRFALDAEGSDHYSDTLDLIPAINESVGWLISVVNSTLGNKKLGEEIFRELSESVVVRTDMFSRFSMDILPDKAWTILAIYPKPTVTPSGLPTVPTPLDGVSYYLSDFYHISSDYSAKRLTIEEWAINKNNPFEKGNTIIDSNCPELLEYAYLDSYNYLKEGASANPVYSTIEVRPSVPKEKVSVFYVKKPTPAVNTTDTIPFPDTVFPLIFNKALQYVAYKQGDNTTLYSVTSADIAQLIKTVV